VLYSYDAVLFQAVLALDGDVGERAALLRTPWRADEWTALLRARHTTLHEVLGRKADLQSVKRNLVEAYESEFGVEFRDADLTLSEHARYATAQREQAAGAARGIVPGIAIRIAVAEQERGGARLAACVAFDDARIVRQVWFRGFVLRPAHALPDLEAALRNVAADGVEEAVRRFFSSHAVRCEGCAPAQFGLLVRRAVDQPLLAR
jgi:hypothetical protein